jgi:hypothetical protein
VPLAAAVAARRLAKALGGRVESAGLQARVRCPGSPNLRGGVTAPLKLEAGALFTPPAVLSLDMYQYRAAA